jgi:hypothetical protein
MDSQEIQVGWVLKEELWRKNGGTRVCGWVKNMVAERWVTYSESQPCGSTFQCMFGYKGSGHSRVGSIDHLRLFIYLAWLAMLIPDDRTPDESDEITIMTSESGRMTVLQYVLHIIMYKYKHNTDVSCPRNLRNLGPLSKHRVQNQLWEIMNLLK